MIVVRNKKKISVGIIGAYTFESKNPIHLQHLRTVDWLVEDDYLSHFNDNIQKLVRTPGIVTGATFDISTTKDIY